MSKARNRKRDFLEFLLLVMVAVVTLLIVNAVQAKGSPVLPGPSAGSHGSVQSRR